MKIALKFPTEGEIRSIEEIDNAISSVINKEKTDFEYLNCLLMSYLKDKSLILRYLVHRLEKNKGIIDQYILCLFWVLNVEKEKESWVEFQQLYHGIHNGPNSPDFRCGIFLSWIGEGKKVLDVGVHTGINANEIAKKNEVIGIDLPRVIEMHSSSYNFKCFPHNADDRMYLFEDNKFDFVVAGEIIEHLLHPGSFIKECYRVLKPDGKIIISSPYRKKGFEEALHCNMVDEEFIKKIFSDFFVVEKIEERFKEERESLILIGRSTKK